MDTAALIVTLIWCVIITAVAWDERRRESHWNKFVRDAKRRAEELRDLDL